MELDASERALRAELEMLPGSFLAAALSGSWDEAGLRRLSRLMREACARRQEQPMIERWLAEGFYFLDTQFDRHFPPSLKLSPEFLSGLKEHMMLLASWLFSGDCPLRDSTAFEHELEVLIAASQQSTPVGNAS